MATQGVESLREDLAPQLSTPLWLWTWSGICFGYRKEDWLFTYDGIGAGRFVGDEVYGASGKYLGELKSTGKELRLTASNYKVSRSVAAFSSKSEHASERPANRPVEKLYCGYQDFPSPEIFKVEVLRTLDSRSAISSASNPRRAVLPRARPTEKIDAPKLHQQMPRVKHAVAVDANALAELLSTTRPRNETCSPENAASGKSNPILASSHLARPIMTFGKSEDRTTPSQADSIAENRRQLILDIRSRISQRRMRSPATGPNLNQ